MAEPVLDIRHLTKRYGTFTALDEVTLQIGAGEIFGLLGPNGAGKTTLIGSVCGLVRKTAGAIRVFGIDLDSDPLSPRFHVGLVPQEINFDPFFTPEEVLRIQLGLYGKARDDARVREVLAALNLSDKANAPSRALSGGMKRRLLIAKALVHRPRLLFLDEPTAGVDVELRRDLWAYVRRLRAEGMTIVLTTHYLEEAEELADRIGIIDRGRLLVVEEKRSLMRRHGERRLEVHFGEPVPALPESVIGAGARLSEDRRSMMYAERNGRASCSEVLGAVYASKLPVTAVGSRAPRLEDVLLQVLRQPESADLGRV
ncbi:MAG TPA: ABC transporter ATP-binding protein [Myxococcaceae bacterium]|nr:ABC transporter ATP-binding protein [Myxococcaceae bacterium]